MVEEHPAIVAEEQNRKVHEWEGDLCTTEVRTHIIT